MTLNIIGIGLGDYYDITIRGKELIESSDIIYLEYYTSKYANYDHDPKFLKEEFKNLFGKDLIIAYRDMIEQGEDKIINEAKEKKVSILVIGDSLSATTHSEYLLEAKKQNINVNIVHNASIFNAVAITGLQLYKFGKTASLVFEDRIDQLPLAPYTILKQNKEIGAHTLFLLDLMIDEKNQRFMTANKAIEILLKTDEIYKSENNNKSLFNEDTYCVVCSRIGGKFKIKSGKAKDLKNLDYGKPLHCLIVPGNMHFVEEDVLAQYEN